jgi:hypothetical protein
MNYIYHRVPPDLTGEILYPLNQLKAIYPDLHTKKIAKYIGREEVINQHIPTLDCLWNDVLHFTPIHPQEVKDTLIEAGRTESLSLRYYQVDPHLFNPEKTTIFLYDHTTTRYELLPINFRSFDPDNLEQYAHYTQITKDYFKEMYAKGAKPLLFHRVPHILYHGTLEVKDLPIIEV